jgi:hypothetical protein
MGRNSWRGMAASETRSIGCPKASGQPHKRTVPSSTAKSTRPIAPQGAQDTTELWLLGTKRIGDIVRQQSPIRSIKCLSICPLRDPRPAPRWAVRIDPGVLGATEAYPIRKSGAYLRISRRAMVILWTSSGPSAMRSVRMWAYISANGKNWVRPAAP